MGFKEEIKVYLSTVAATELDEGMSRAQWNLKTPVNTPNANYKIKYQVSNALFPSSYAKISPDRENNTMTIAYSTDPDFDVGTQIAANKFLRVDIDQVVPRLTWGGLQLLINEKLKETVLANDDLKNVRSKPQFFYDGATYMTFAMKVTDWTLPDETFENDEGLPVQTINSGDLDETVYYFKLLTQADQALIEDKYLRLANVVGFPRTRDVPKMKMEADPAVDGYVWANRAPDLLGTRFIKMTTNLKTSALDPNTLEDGNVMCVVPVSNNDTETNGIYYLGNVQQPQYVTLATPTLDRIEIALFDDHNVPLNMHNDWFVELSILFEEEEKTDVYRGTSDFSVPALVHNIRDPRGYETLQQELSKRKLEIDEMETEQRSNNFVRRLN